MEGIGRIFANSLFWFLFALSFALVEIEIEGKYGWAEKLPTFYRTKGFVAKVYGKLMRHRPITGYHLGMYFLILLLFHLPFFSNLDIKWSLLSELKLLSLLFIWFTMWDFLWFVLNPNYGIKKFKKENIWWHGKSPWICGICPDDYVKGIMLFLILAGLASYVSKGYGIFIESLIFLGFWVVFLTLVILWSPIYIRFRKNLSLKDDRSLSSIFHKE